MRKLYLPLAVLMIAVMVLPAAACAPSEIKPATVSLGYISNEWGGEEVIAANVFFTVTNPNPVPVNLDSMNYTVTVGTTNIGMKTMVPNQMIPANGSVNISNTLLIDYSSSLAVQGIYIGQGKDYVTAHVMAASIWKLLGGKKPPLWDYPALGVYAGLKGGPTVDDVKAGTADTGAIVGLYAKLRGTIDAVQGGLDKAWDAAPAGPCTYNVKGMVTISSPALTKSVDTAFDLKFTRP